jgi:hypothetical protein
MIDDELPDPKEEAMLLMRLEQEEETAKMKESLNEQE